MNWFSISGSANRKDAAAICALAGVLSLAVIMLNRSLDLWHLARWVLPFAAIACAAAIATLIRRLHDIGRNGAWIVPILLTLPWIGLALIAALIWQPSARRSHQPSLLGAVMGGSLVVLVLLLGVIGIFWRPMEMLSGEMKPALMIGDRLLVRQGGSAGLSRGDLVLIRHPVTGSEEVYRTIALAGDEVAIQAGQVILNGTPLPQQDAGTFTENYGPQGPRNVLPRCRIEVGLGAPCSAKRVTETLPNGASYYLLDHETRSGPPDHLSSQTVPEGAVYLLLGGAKAGLSLIHI